MYLLGTGLIVIAYSKIFVHAWCTRNSDLHTVLFRRVVKLIENRDYNLQEDIPCYLLKQGQCQLELEIFIPLESRIKWFFFLNSHLCNGTRWFGETTMKTIVQGLEEWQKNFKKLLFYVQMFILFMKKSRNFN